MRYINNCKDIISSIIKKTIVLPSALSRERKYSYDSVRPQLSAELSVRLISWLRNTFRPCFKVLQTDLHLFYKRISRWRQHDNQRKIYSPPNPDGRASITVHGHLLSAAHTTGMQQLSAKSSLLVCRHLPVQNCHFWSTVLKPAGVITLYQLQQLVLMQHYWDTVKTSYE